jgi:hypothetical protein
MRRYFQQHLQSLRGQIDGNIRHACHATARPIQAGDEALFNRIGNQCKYDRDRFGCLPGCQSGRPGRRKKNIDVEMNKLVCKFLQSI